MRPLQELADMGRGESSLYAYFDPKVLPRLSSRPAEVARVPAPQARVRAGAGLGAGALDLAPAGGGGSRRARGRERRWWRRWGCGLGAGLRLPVSGALRGAESTAGPGAMEIGTEISRKIRVRPASGGGGKPGLGGRARGCQE